LEPASVQGEPAPISSLVLATLAYALTLLVLGFRLRAASLRFWSFAVMFGGLLQTLALSQRVSLGFQVASLVALGGMMLAGGYLYVHERRPGPA
jgi:hypothetical protein